VQVIVRIEADLLEHATDEGDGLRQRFSRGVLEQRLDIHCVSHS